MDRLKDKVAVITQAGSYFGRAVAQAYADEGAKLYLQDWEERSDVIQTLADQIRSNSGVEVFEGVWDITSGKETLRMTSDIIENYGKFHH